MLFLNHIHCSDVSVRSIHRRRDRGKLRRRIGIVVAAGSDENSLADNDRSKRPLSHARGSSGRGETVSDINLTLVSSGKRVSPAI